MKLLLILFSALFLSLDSFPQTVEETYPKTLWCANDTFALTFKDFPKVYYFAVSRKDNGSPGTDGRPGEYATLHYGTDSLRLNYHNKVPYAHIIYVNFASPKGKTTLRFHFNEMGSYFSSDYIEKNTGNIQFDIPEPYELANIIWTLSPSGQRAKDLYTTGDYYQRVLKYFKPYLNHPLFKALDFPDSIYFDNYYNFRENSFAFNFPEKATALQKNRLLFNGPYYYVNGGDLADSSLFGKLKNLVQDFAVKSKFRQFYASNKNYYEQQIQRQKQLLPVKQMWTWLEDQFPNRYQSYRVVFSPLIGGSHSTQRFYTFYKSQWFAENVMFICGTDRYDSMPSISEEQKQGLMSGVVFTEIDHNYVNPISDKYGKTIDSIFADRIVWTKPGSNSDNYNTARSVFNEYMTHAAFCVYILETYDKATADYVIDNREQLMVNRRNFIRFKEFDKELMRLYREHKDLKMVGLYPLILDWCKRQL